MKKLQINTGNLSFLSVVRMMCTRVSVAAALLACICGCDGGKDAPETPPAVASQEEPAGPGKPVDGDVQKPQTVVVTTIVEKVAGKVVEKKEDSDDENDDSDENESVRASRADVNPAVTGFTASENGFKLHFTSEPDLWTYVNYIKITPSPGPITMRSPYQHWWDKSVGFSAPLKPRTTYKLVVRAGMPMKNGRVTAKDFVHVWKTGDASKSVEFASGGRYLPAAGSHAVSVRTMNVTNLFCQIRTVPLRNIVQLLSREEGQYGRYYGGGGDSKETQDISGEPVSRPLRPKATLNESCETSLVVRNDDGETAKGVYLLSARDEDTAGMSEWEVSQATAWKLVCVTDIGLSVREANGTVYVWATSLTKGTPIKGLRVLVYGSNNVEMGEGLTDADGWCACEMPDAGKPFAVVAACMDGSDTSFLAMRGELDETAEIGARRDFLSDNQSEAFVWTERGIYRHNEPILIHALVRNGKGNAPKPMPLTVALIDADGKDFKTRTQLTDAYGTITLEDFAVTDDQPSGRWIIEVRTPGKDPFVLGSRDIKIEEFVPPQIRVKVTPPASEMLVMSDIEFSVKGEHLFGAPAKGLPAEGVYMFEDAPFAPRGWEAFRFGDQTRRLIPNFKALDKVTTDANGSAKFSVRFPERAKPAAAVKMTVQGSVFEGGGRPASARASGIIHVYPHYIGVALPEAIRESAEPHECRIAIVNHDGTPCAGERKLFARFEQIERVYGLQKTDGGCWEWKSETVRYPMGDDEEIKVSASGTAVLKVPAGAVGDYAVRIYENEPTGISFGMSYSITGKNDPLVRASLENPSRVTLAADKKVYYEGERPIITIKSPFAGYAWLNVLRNEMVYSQVFALTNATSEIVLEPVKGEWSPSLDVAVSVVQAARPGQRTGVMNRAFGLVPIRVATHDSELDVKVKADVVCAPQGGSRLTVELDAKNQYACGEQALVTVTDEGIHLLTDEKVPDPISWFGEIRHAEDHLWDIYNRLLPILADNIKRSGVKTGGGGEGDLLRRVSAVPTRRFKPLSIWQKKVVLKDGRAAIPFTLPEFVGEVRVTAVACNKRARGAGAVQAKVAPNLVMQPDAPRFAAPGDTFLATVMFSNRSGKEGKFTYDLMTGGAVSLARPVHGELALADGQSEVLSFPVTAAQTPGEGTLVFVSEGMGEKHTNEIKLPVRPAVPWAKSVETIVVNPGETKTFANSATFMPDAARRTFVASGNHVAELASALEYLIGYPYGCLEQTTARVFPLVTAGGILNTLPVAGISSAESARDVVSAGIRRVCSMMRSNDFVMWPDGNVRPWDRNVSLWAAHFLAEADKNGFPVPANRISKVKEFLRSWSMSTNETVSVYALHTLALAGTPDRDRMLTWYDKREKLPALERARLARAFRQAGDPNRARNLLADTNSSDLKDSSFMLLALLELDPADDRIVPLVKKILDMRTGAVRHWQTTEGNAHALLALGAYYRTVPPSNGKPALSITVNGNKDDLLVKKAKNITGCSDVTVSNTGDGTAYLSVSTLALTDPAQVKPQSAGIEISRRYYDTNGNEADLTKLVRGDMLIAEVVITAPVKTTYSDLVIEELLPACFEPDSTKVTENTYSWLKRIGSGINWWELRREMRDDRVLGFSKRVERAIGSKMYFHYAVRVVSAGEFVAPGPSVEAMYEPQIRARGPVSRIKIEK